MYSQRRYSLFSAPIEGSAPPLCLVAGSDRVGCARPSRSNWLWSIRFGPAAAGAADRGTPANRSELSASRTRSMKEPMETASTPPAAQNSRDQDRRVAGDEESVFMAGPSRSSKTWSAPTAIVKGDSKLLDVDLRLSFVVEMTSVKRHFIDNFPEGFEPGLQEGAGASCRNKAVLSCPGSFQELAVFR